MSLLLLALWLALISAFVLGLVLVLAVSLARRTEGAEEDSGMVLEGVNDGGGDGMLAFILSANFDTTLGALGVGMYTGSSRAFSSGSLSQPSFIQSSSPAPANPDPR